MSVAAHAADVTGRAEQGARGLALLLGVLLVLPGCATRAGFEARMSTLVGVTEGQLVAALGVPQGVHEAEGTRFLQFEEQRFIPIPGSPGPWGMRGWGGWGFPPTVEVRTCATTFAMRDGRVASFTFRGNGCTSVMPT